MRSALLAAVVAVVGGAPGIADAGTGAALMRYLPDDTAEVMVIDVAHARSGAALGRLVAQLRAHAPRWEAVAAGGVELGTAIDTLVVAASPDGDGRNRHTIAIVDGKVGPILARLKTGAGPVGHDGVAIYAIDGGEAAIVDRHLLITTRGDMAAAIDRAHRSRAAAAAALAASGTAATVHALLAATAGSGADVWGGTIFDAKDRAVIAQQLGGEPLWIAFALAASARASLDVRFAFVDEHAATAATGELQRMVAGPDAQLLPTLQTAIGPEFAESLSVDKDRSEVHLSAAMSGDEADRLGNLLGSGL